MPSDQNCTSLLHGFDRLKITIPDGDDDKDESTHKKSSQLVKNVRGLLDKLSLGDTPEDTDKLEDCLRCIDIQIGQQQVHLTEISDNLTQELKDYIDDQPKSKIHQWLTTFDEDFEQFLIYKDLVFNHEDGELLLWQRKQKLHLLGVNYGQDFFSKELSRIKEHVRQLFKIANHFQKQLELFKAIVEAAGGGSQQLLFEIDSRSTRCRTVIYDEIVRSSFVPIDQSQVVKNRTTLRMKAHFLLASDFGCKLSICICNQLKCNSHPQ